MSKKKKNGKPTNRELRRARERVMLAGVVVPDLTSAPLARFRIGDWVRINAKQSANWGLEFKIAHYYYHPMFEHYRFCAATTDHVPQYVVKHGYPAEDLALIEGTPARVAGLDLGEL